MTDEEYYGRISDLTQKAKQNPLQYEKTVRWFARIGYLYISALLMALLLIAGTLCFLYFLTGGQELWLVVTLFPLGAFFYLLRKIIKRVPKPTSIEIFREDAPSLFDWLDEMQNEFKLKKVEKVYITSDFNASVTQYPSFGLLGGWKNYLFLGLPLMDVVTPEHLKSILVHEYAHLAGNHGKTSVRVGHLQYLWQRVINNEHNDNLIMNFISRPFLNWFVPRFDAYAHVLKHNNELYCDSVAAQYCGVFNTASSLVTIHAIGAYFDNLYHQRFKEAMATNQKLDAENFKVRLNLIHEANRSGEFLKIEQEEFEKPAALIDSHPTLKQRLHNLGVIVEKVDDLKRYIQFPDTDKHSATKQLFGEQENNCRILVRDEYEKRFNADMALKNETRRLITTYYDDIKDMPIEKMDSHTIINMYECLRHLYRTDEAASFAEKAYELRSDDPEVQAVYGRSLISLMKDERGIDIIRNLPLKTPIYSLALSYQTAAAFLRERKGEKEAEQFLDSIKNIYMDSANSFNDQMNFAHFKEFTSVKVSEWDERFISRTLDYIAVVKKAWLIRNVNSKPGVRETHIMIVQTPWRMPKSAAFNEELVQSLSHNLSIFYPCRVVSVKDVPFAMMRKIKRKQAALIYKN